MGNATLRTLLIIGATLVLRHVRKGANGPAWLIGLLARRPPKVVAVALANKMARIVFALLTKGGIQKAPVGNRYGTCSLTTREGTKLPARSTAARQKDQGAHDNDDPTGRYPDARQAAYTSAPLRAWTCLATRAADFIEASGHMRRN